MPSQCRHREHGCRPQGGAVVAVQHRAHRHDVDALGQGGAPRQMRGVFGAVGVMHLEADDLAAVKIEDQIQIEATSLDLCRQKRHVPAPDLARTCGNVRRRGREMRGGWARPRRCIWPCAATRDGSWTCWRCRSLRQPVQARSAPAAPRQSVVRSPPR